MKRAFKIFIFILIVNYGYTQELTIGLKGGLGVYAMSDLKPLNNFTLQYLPFDAQTVSNFPPFLFYQSVFSLSFNNYRIGLIYTFQSTGSRVSAKDYSGEYHFDMKVHSHTPGIYQEFTLLSLNSYQFSIYSDLGLLFSTLEMKENLSLSGKEIFDDSDLFRSVNYYVEPGISFSHSINHLLNIAINSGYLIQFGNQAFYAANDKGNVLKNPGEREPVMPAWNGFRFGLSVYCKINRKNR